MRQATGSATAGIVAPVVAGLSTTHNSPKALAIGAGSVFFCHANDAGFWVVREYFGLQLKQTVIVWSVLQTIVSVVGFALTLVLWSALT
jgi:GntP family gluconate:H+ symporter